jgi:phosphatidylglycerol---prolipoprotein diacylglyceryl transferase
MQPELDLGPITMQTFGLVFGLAFVVGGLVAAKRLRELGKPPDWAFELAFATLIGGFVGARLWSVAENWSELDDDLLRNLAFDGGLVWYGGVLGATAGTLLWARFRGMLDLGLLDFGAILLAIGYAVGRIGCQLSGDGDYGVPWDGPWAMAYPDGTVPTDTPVHPTPIYETLAMGLIAYILWRLRDALQPGLVFALYLLLAGAERFLIEFIRRNEDVAAGLTQAQLISVAMIVVGATWLAVKARRGELAAEPSPSPRAAPV